MNDNYYQILGINENTPKNEIKTTYHKLAMQYHPDRNQGDKSCEEKFKTILEAYSTLSDDRKRADYDFIRRQRTSVPNYQSKTQQPKKPENYWYNTQSTKDNVRSGFGQRGSNIGGNGFRNYDNIYENVKNDYQNKQEFDSWYKSIKTTINEIKNETSVSVWRKKSIPKGSHIKVVVSLSLNEIAKGYTKKINIDKYNNCSNCNGNGFTEENFYDDCKVCQGDGMLIENTEISVVIPPRFIGRIIKEGQGDVGGNRKDGNLIIEVEAIKDAKYDLIENNIFSDAVISVEQSFMGSKIVVETLFGKKTLDIHPATVNGEIFIIKGHGLKNEHNQIGDHFVEIKIDPTIEEKKKVEAGTSTSFIDMLKYDIAEKYRKEMLKRMKEKEGVKTKKNI